MLTPDARTAVAIHSMISSQGVKLKDVRFEPHSFNLEDLISKKTDAMGSYLSNEPYLLQEKNIPYNILDPKDYGFDFYGGILFTSERELENHPNRLQNMRSAVLKGWAYAFENIDETVDLIMNKYNTQKKSRSSLIFEAQVLKELAEYDKGSLGKIKHSKVNEIMKIYSLLGYTNNPRALDNFIINPDDILLSREEKKYLKENTINYVSYMVPPFSMDIGTQSIESDYIKLFREKINIDIKTNLETANSFASNQITDKSADFKIAISNDDIKNPNIVLSNSLTKYDITIATLTDKGYFASTDMLSGRKIAIRKDCVFLEQFKKAYPKINFILVNTTKEALNLVVQKKVFAAIDILPLLTYQIQNMMLTDIKISGTTEFKYNIQYMVHKDNPLLLSILNKTIEKISPNEKQDIDLHYVTAKYIRLVDNSTIYKVGIPLIIVIIIIIIANLKLSKEVRRRKLAESTLHSIANTDELTGLFNRRKMIKILVDGILLSKRYERPISIIFFDIDNFKSINDTFGHAVGDDILKEISAIVKENIRTTDSFGRWGGEEFLIILPETSRENAQRTAENLREIIFGTSFKVCSQISCSFGVSQLREEDTKKSFITRADESMYYVKKNGKNGVKAD
jgi:polar amino acid transport system substrate-binding protein